MAVEAALELSRALAVQESQAMRPRLLDWVFTIPFLIGFAATLLVFDPFQRIARLFGQRPQEYVAGALQVALVWVFGLAGTKLKVDRSPLASEGGSYLFISNHQSLFDIPIFGAVLFSNFPKYVSKRELANWIPSISYNLRRGGNALIDRGDRGQATEEIRALGRQVCERGVSAVLYPEGTRARDGELAAFKPTGARALLESAPGVPVVPVTIDGSWRLLRFNLMPVPFGTQIRMKIGEPIERGPDEDPVALLAAVRKEIEGNLESWRAGRDSCTSI